MGFHLQVQITWCLNPNGSRYGFSVSTIPMGSGTGNPRYHTALWQALHIIMHPALILTGTIHLDKSSHDFFHSHCHLLTPMIIMEHPLMSSTVASLSTSIHCVENYPVHPKEVYTHPSISTLRSTTPLLPSFHSYLPVPFISARTIHICPYHP